METHKRIIIRTDGGARGNPGPAAIGVVIELSDGSRRKEYGEQIGNTTNNVAEYKAVVFGLKKAKHLFGKDRENLEAEVRSDSELIISQLNGLYKMKDAELFPFFIEIWNLRQDFKGVKFVHVPREENKEADRLVNQALDTLGI